MWFLSLMCLSRYIVTHRLSSPTIVLPDDDESGWRWLRLPRGERIATSSARGGSRALPSSSRLAGVDRGAHPPGHRAASAEGPAGSCPSASPLMAIPLLFRKRFPFAAPVATVLVGDRFAFATTGRAGHGRLRRDLPALPRRLAVRPSRPALVGGGAAAPPRHGRRGRRAGRPDDRRQLSSSRGIFFTLFWGASVFVTAREEHAQEAEDRARAARNRAGDGSVRRPSPRSASGSRGSCTT